LLMEDIGLSRRLKALAEPGVLKLTLTTSGRRWETHGWVSTVVKMSAFRLLYWLGVSPTKLHRWYQNVR
ncbi:MAG: glycosyl transferase, partial [Pseudomonadales bacterium]